MESYQEINYIKHIPVHSKSKAARCQLDSIWFSSDSEINLYLDLERNISAHQSDILHKQ